MTRPEAAQRLAESLAPGDVGVDGRRSGVVEVSRWRPDSAGITELEQMMSGGKLPIHLQYERDRMMALVDEMSDELYDNPAWLMALGVEAIFDDGWFELRKGGHGFLVEAGPGLTVHVNGKAERPKHLFFDGVYFRSMKARIVRWACECESDNDA